MFTPLPGVLIKFMNNFLFLFHTIRLSACKSATGSFRPFVSASSSPVKYLGKRPVQCPVAMSMWLSVYIQPLNFKQLRLHTGCYPVTRHPKPKIGFRARSQVLSSRLLAVSLHRGNWLLAILE